jgi:flagella basal body P-ring formation protein FlgA
MHIWTLFLAAAMAGLSPARAQPLQLASLSQQAAGCQDTTSGERGALAELTIAIEHRLGYCVEIELKPEDMRILVTAARMSPQDVSELRISAVEGTFLATIAEPNRSPLTPGASRLLQGRFHRAQTVAMATRRLSTGDTITEDDIELVRIRASRVPHQAAVDATRLVGMQARWPIPPRTVMLTSQVRSPVVVDKGASVTVVVRTTNLTVAAAGTALEAGASGQLIEIRSQSTNKKIRARVKDANTVILE